MLNLKAYTLCSVALNISMAFFVLADTLGSASAVVVSGCLGTGFTESAAGEILALETGPGVFPAGAMPPVFPPVSVTHCNRMGTRATRSRISSTTSR